MPAWLRDSIAAIARVLVGIAVLIVSLVFGIAVFSQVGDSYWVVVLSAVAFALFVVLPLHLAFVLYRSRRRM